MKRTIKIMLLSIIALATAVTTMSAQKTDDLQAYINSLASKSSAKVLSQRAAESNQTIIDLSTFSATDRSTTLYIRGGINVKFINGSLNRTEKLVGPVVAVTENSIVELGEEAQIHSQYISSNYPLVDVNKGTFKVSTGAQMMAKWRDGVIGEQGKDHNHTKTDVAVRLNTSEDAFYLKGGSILYGSVNVENSFAKVELSDDAWMGESSYIWSHADVHLADFTYLTCAHVVDGAAIALNQPIKAHHLPICIDPLAQDDTVVVYGEDYTITEEDLAKIEVYSEDNTIPGYSVNQKLPIYLKDNKVYVGKSSPNEVTNEDDLQRYLDELAKNGTGTEEHPDTIWIAEDGFTITKYIKINSKVHVVIKGGTLRFTHQETSFFYIDGDLRFENIVIDLRLWCTTYTNNYLFTIYRTGTLHIGQGVNFTNITDNNHSSLCHFAGGGTIHYYSGTFISYGNIFYGDSGHIYIYGGTLESHASVVYCKYAKVYIYGGRINGYGGTIFYNVGGHFECWDGIIYVYNPGSIVVQADTGNIISGIIHGTTFDFYIYITKTVIINPATYLYDLKFRIEKETLVTIQGKLSNSLYFYGDWTKFNLGDIIVCSGNDYQLTYTDFEHMVFIDLTPGIKPYFNETDHTVRLHIDDLQDYLDWLTRNGKTGTEEEPEEIPVPEEPIIGDITMPDDLQAFLDGLNPDGTTKEITMSSCVFTIPVRSSLRISNLSFISTNDISYFKVGGRFFIGENIKISGFNHFVSLLKGGCIYIKQKISIHINIIIIDGNIDMSNPIISGYNGYVITEEDMKYITITLPTGYEWKLIDGCIYISQTSGITSLTYENDISTCYSLDGRRIQNSNKGVYIERLKDGKFRKVLK